MSDVEPLGGLMRSRLHGPNCLPTTPVGFLRRANPDGGGVDISIVLFH